MGDAANFRYGRRKVDNGLEFLSARKTSRFAQYVQQFNTQQPTQHVPVQNNNAGAPVPPQHIQQQSYQQPIPIPATQPFAASATLTQAYQPVQQQSTPPPIQQQAPVVPLQQRYAAYALTQTPEQYLPPIQPQANQQIYADSQSLPVQSYSQNATEPTSEQQPVFRFENEDTLGMEEPDVTALFEGEEDQQTPKVTYKKAPESHIIRPMLQKKEPVSKLKIAFGTLGVLVGFAILGVSGMFLLQNRPAVSAGIKAQAGFPLYEVASNPKFKVDRDSVEFSENDSVVYFVYQKDNKAKFIISQQALPEVIKGDAQYQQFLNETDKYASMETKIGKAYFTKPANIGNDVSVVVKTETTLMFIRGPGDTSEQDWASLMATLIMQYLQHCKELMNNNIVQEVSPLFYMLL